MKYVEYNKKKSPSGNKRDIPNKKSFPLLKIIIYSCQIES